MEAIGVAMLMKMAPALISLVIGPMVTGLVRKYMTAIPPKYAPVVSGVSAAVIAGLTGEIPGAEAVAIDPSQAAAESAVAQAMWDRKPTVGDDEHAQNGGNAV